jgi:hypothetical protein
MVISSFIRSWLYLVSGLVFSLLGWNVGQMLLTDLGLLKQFPEVVLFPCITISLAVGMMLTEVFISNPTRLKLSWYTAKASLKWAIGLGLLAGIVSGIICRVLFWPALHTSSYVVRISGWLMIGAFVGLAEGLTWQKRSIEAGSKERAASRLKASFFGGVGGSLMAAIIFEVLRKSLGDQLPGLQNLEDPIGFAILGICLGFVFSYSSSPSYMVALRAGGGFEYKSNNITGIGASDDDLSTSPSLNPDLDKNVRLTFINDDNQLMIEEGLSIKLPPSGSINIGSGIGCHIRIPSIPTHVAKIEIEGRSAKLMPNRGYYGAIEIDGQPCTSSNSVSLKHNSVITFYEVKESAKAIIPDKFYRFVYYNRFLDPQA